MVEARPHLHPLQTLIDEEIEKTEQSIFDLNPVRREDYQAFLKTVNSLGEQFVEGISRIQRSIEHCKRRDNASRN